MKKTDRILNILYPILLMAYPLIRVTQGLSIIDTTYSPGNYIFHDSMSGTWIVATYLANSLGHLLTKLPFGSTLLGLNIYTSFLAGIIAVATYLVLSKDLGIHLTFLGEIMALGLCWCPTTILYNYLTYFLMNAGVLLLYAALRGRGRKEAFRLGKISIYRSELLCLLAGAALGSNVITRFPNVAEAAFILVVWYVSFIDREPVSEAVRKTVFCMLGYLAGFGVCFGALCRRFGAEAYTDMIKALFAMTDKAADYKPASMILAMLEDYLYAKWWILAWMAAAASGIVIWCVLSFAGKLFNLQKREKSAGVSIPDIITLAGMILSFALCIRLCYGRGMFSFRYYEYGSVYFWVVILLFASTFCCIGMLFFKKLIGKQPGKQKSETDRAQMLTERRGKILALSVLLIIYITCIGSNNGLYPIMNNMFIVAPFMIRISVDMICGFARKIKNGADVSGGRFGNGAGIFLSGGFTVLLFALCAGTFIQSIGFHSKFAFGDGVDGEPREAMISGYERADHIHTGSFNAATLQGLMDFISSDRKGNDALITYGDIPGMGYMLDMPSAVSTFWPDLDSYNYYEWERDMDVLENGSGDIPAWKDREAKPYVIVTLPVAAYIEKDKTAMEYFGVDAEEFGEDLKLNDLAAFVGTHGYTQVYSNDAYVVYKSL